MRDRIDIEDDTYMVGRTVWGGPRTKTHEEIVEEYLRLQLEVLLDIRDALTKTRDEQ